MRKPKRVVSIGEYVVYLCRLITKTGAAYLLETVGLWGMVAGVIWMAIVLLGLIGEHADYPSRNAIPRIGTEVGAVMGVSCLLKLCGKALFRSADQMEEVIPLTRSTADQLPSEDVLVRSSSEPTTPESVLLRAAASGEGAESEKELLRASTIGEKETQ